MDKEKRLQYNYVSRKLKKREKRTEWINKISAAVRNNMTIYSKVMAQMYKAKIQINRKMLAELSTNEPKIMKELLRFLNTI